MGNLIRGPKPAPPVTLRDFYNKRNTILVVREAGGLGDILMHRMMFEDFKRVFPGCQIEWAVPPDYFQAAQDHPFVDKVLDCRHVNIHDYLISYNTTTACGRHEIRVAPLADKHRSDIWANHCGVLLSRHNMHLKIDPQAKAWAMEKLRMVRSGRAGPLVALSPISAQVGKNLTAEQMSWFARHLHQRGCCVFGLHQCPIEELQPFPVLWGMNQREWMAIIDSADYVVSVDTASFHCAGGLKKPLMGIFTYVDGKVYGKYYDFVLVQKHRDNGNWDCGPCFNWPNCPKSQEAVKPCLTEIGPDLLAEGVEKMFQKWPPTLP